MRAMPAINREIEIKVYPTPAELAECFCDLDCKQQADFFEGIAKITQTLERPFAFQLEYIRQEKLSNAARRIMHQIGEYAYKEQNNEYVKDSDRLSWLLSRGIAWRNCYDETWQDGEWLYEWQGARKQIDEAIKNE